MPDSLLNELKKLVTPNYYMDVSDEVRSIVREKYLESKDPYLYEIKKLRKDIYQELKDKQLKKARKQVVEELNQIKDKIGEED
jgi:hypothetical protein